MASFEITKNYVGSGLHMPQAQIHILCEGGIVGTVSVTLTQLTDVIQR